MAAKGQGTGGLNQNTFQMVAAIVDAYHEMDMPLQQYLLLIVAPSSVFFVATVTLAIITSGIPVFVRLLIPLLGLFILTVAIFYPKVLLDQKRKEMEDRLHIFITHMTILATTNIDRVEVFRTLAQEDEYKSLAEEASRIVQLVDTWNQSLDDACRIRARNVPSKPLSNLLDRLSYTISAGQDLRDFLLTEQDVVIHKYTTIYEASLDNLEVMKDLYLSMVLSVTFALVFGTVLPILTGTNPTITVSLVILLFAFVQIGFLVAIKSVAPYDPLWFHPEYKHTDIERRIRVSVVIGVLLCFATMAGCLAVRMGMTSIDPDRLPLVMYAAIPTTPMVIPGFVIRREENRVKERDEEFTNFIRALGASESAKQSTTSKVLESLRRKDFGALTGDINDLYKRLNMRIEPEMAWRHFSADCRSYLIQKFSEMYLIGRQMGGRPKQLGELISENMNVVIQLRERRTQATVTMIGVLYGISAAAAFAFFIGLEIVTVLSGLSMNLDTEQLGVGTLIHTGVYNVPFIEFLLIIIVLLNALLSSVMIRITDGGHKVNSYFHFVVLTWLCCVIAIITRRLVGGFIGI